MNRNTKKILYGSILLITLGWSVNYFFNYSIRKSELTEISGYLHNEPKFDKGKGGWYMELDLNSDEYRYQTDGLSYDALDVDGVKSELNAGSQIQILVAKNTGFEEMMNLFVGIKRIYGLKSNKKTFLKLNDYNKGKEGTRYSALFIWLIFAGLFIYNFWIKKDAL